MNAPAMPLKALSILYHIPSNCLCLKTISESQINIFVALHLSKLSKIIFAPRYTELCPELSSKDEAPMDKKIPVTVQLLEVNQSIIPAKLVPVKTGSGNPRGESYLFWVPDKNIRE